MTPLPAYAQLSRADDSVTLALEVPREFAAIDGHFPGTPILPAVMQIDWAIRLAREHFTLPGHCHTLRALKFLRVVQPPVTLTLELARLDDGRSVTFAYTHGISACATGRIEFTDDAARTDRSFL